jgi:single-stranded-DNA-specific exonuclease
MPIADTAAPKSAATEEFFLTRLGRLLKARGVTTLEEAERFLYPSYDEHLHDPFLLHDMDKAIATLTAALSGGERIAIFSDYDCDGIPGGVILHDLFKAIAYDNFQNYIPHRHFEGFGLNFGAIDTLKSDNVSLIITVDCGIADSKVIAYAYERGLKVIVTDHHEPPPDLPRAEALVNPKLGHYPFPEICGSAVAFKLAQALLSTGRLAVPPGGEKWWLDMVGLATIADMVPLTGENRVLAHFGLKVLRRARRPGLRALYSQHRLSPSHLSEDDVGFTIAPRLNAASRLCAPKEAFSLLTTISVVEAKEQAERLEKLNRERKAAVAQITRELHERLKLFEEEPSVLVFGNPSWRPSLLGLAAGKLADEYRRPVFLWGRDGNGLIKGSCRAGGQVSVLALMQTAPHLFLEYGGHHFSGGFSVRAESIHALGKELQLAYLRLGPATLAAADHAVDETLTLEEVDETLRLDLRRLSPFGIGNPKPIFAFNNVAPARLERFGRDKEHLKLVFETARGELEAVAFFTKPEAFSVTPEVGTPLTMLAHVEESYFAYRQRLRLRIVDLRQRAS